jgi:Cu(I)/Ag(I) efflux system membrane fusion protein/cobalt-zinc-cadmium efflux system membrane fusion protein
MPIAGTKAFCPVMENEFTVKEDSEYSEYEGKYYVFCCAGCKPTFDDNPKRFIKVLENREAQHNAASSQSAGTPESSAGKGKIKYWVAPMDPKYISDKPGKSPMGMDLVPVYEGDKPAQASSGKEVVIDPVVVQNMGVRVEKVEHGTIFRHVRTLGEILVAEDQVSVVNLRFNGWIEKIYVDQTGQKVKKGQKLFSVYSPELVSAQDEYLLAVKADGADSRLARSTARRLELWGISKGYIAKIANTGKTLRNITISAPRSGYVLHKNIVQGARVQAGSDLYRIGDLDRIWVNAEVYEHDAAWVQVGQKATMELSFQQGKTWEGNVSYVYPTLNPKTRTMTVRLEFNNPGLNMKPGMLAIVRIESQKKEHILTVPSEAVMHSGERRLVFIVRGYGRYEPREIITGIVGDNHQTEVLEGLTKGEQVVVSGQFLLDSESQLQEAVAKLLEARLQAKKSRGEVPDKVPSKNEGKISYWTCGMHPEVVQDARGTCPQCGMDLVKKTR